MEILDVPEKLQQAILNPDKRLTVDLRVRTALLSAVFAAMTDSSCEQLLSAC